MALTAEHSGAVLKKSFVLTGNVADEAGDALGRLPLWREHGVSAEGVLMGKLLPVGIATGVPSGAPIVNPSLRINVRPLHTPAHRWQ